MATRNYQSIGEVLVGVKTEFPDITISKIRFLESEGLIEPERTPSGYRKFYPDDVERLRSILRMQRDEYLPLKVIKERLVQQDAGDPSDTSIEEAVGGGDAAAGNGSRRRRRPRRGADRAADVARGDGDRHRRRPRADQGARAVPDHLLARPRGRPLLRRRRLHRAVDREGLPAPRDRAPPPHDVPAFRRARVRVLRGARGPDPAAAQPRRAPRRSPDPRRAHRPPRASSSRRCSATRCANTSSPRDGTAPASPVRRRRSSACC